MNVGSHLSKNPEIGFAGHDRFVSLCHAANYWDAAQRTIHLLFFLGEYRVRKLQIPLASLIAVAAALILIAAHAEEMNAPTYSNSQAIPWDDLSNTEDRNWSEAASKKAEQLQRFSSAIRMKRVFYSEDFRLGYIILAPSAVYPAHVHPAPEVYHMLSGTAEWTVDGETKVVGPGETIYMKPHASHRTRVVSEEPMKAIWAQWAPDGDQGYMDRGYKLLEDLPPLPDIARVSGDPKFLPMTNSDCHDIPQS